MQTRRSVFARLPIPKTQNGKRKQISASRATELTKASKVQDNSDGPNINATCVVEYFDTHAAE